jgi:hypothetical protein
MNYILKNMHLSNCNIFCETWTLNKALRNTSMPLNTNASRYHGMREDQTNPFDKNYKLDRNW